jgi:signal transduction histidine kinase
MDARENRFLADFSPFGCERLLGHLVYQDLTAGDYLFHQGDPAEGVCLVLSGQVEIVKAAGNREQILACFEAGDFLGEVAVLDGHGRSTSARAREDSYIATIPRDILLEVLLTEPVTLTLHLFQNVLNHLRHTNDLFVDELVHKEKLSLIGEMATSLMHDLRNPVQVILSAADVIRMNHSDPETVDCCEKMRLQCDRLVTMAGELLEFSKGESKLHFNHTDTTALLQQFLSFNEDYFQQTGLKISVEAEPAEIEVDSMRLLRVLQNLVTNAVEAIGSRPEGHIEVKAWVSDSVLYLSVSDNGPGIPNEIRNRIFDPFVTQGKQGGTGLGMAIVQSVVLAHRGKITFETEIGQGTQFLVRIPQDAASAPVK